MSTPSLAAAAAGYYSGFIAADAAPKLVTPDEINNVEVRQKAARAVVTVVAKYPPEQLQPGEPAEGYSSGFFISPTLVVTNYHAIDGAIGYSVILHDGTTRPVTIYNLDPGIDIALLEVKGIKAPGVLRFGDSSSLVPGQKLIVLGSPNGYPNNMSVGVFSSFNRVEPPVDEIGTEIPRMILTDANIQQGNSGGPILDSRGNVVGVADASIQNAVGTGGLLGLGIPAALVSQSVSDLQKFGSTQRGSLGQDVKLRDLSDIDPVFLKAVGLNSSNGAVVDSVPPGTPAARAGLRGSRRDPNSGKLTEIGDIILKVNDKQVRDRYDVIQEVSRFRPGQSVTLSLWRNNRPVTVKVAITARTAG